jgi:hypothetical protein
MVEYFWYKIEYFGCKKMNILENVKEIMRKISINIQWIMYKMIEAMEWLSRKYSSIGSCVTLVTRLFDKTNSTELISFVK